jgi:hypothetical protein
MAVKYEKSKVGTKLDVDGVKCRVSNEECLMPKSAESVDDILQLCDGKLTSARGEKPGLIDAALSGIVAFLRRVEVKRIETLMGGKEEAIKNLVATLMQYPGQTIEKATAFATEIVNSGWTEEQEKARQSLKIEPLKKEEDDEEEDENPDEVKPDAEVK